MSGHSKWHSIRHKKAATDAKRGKLFTKIIKEIAVAAKLGGGDEEMNPRLRQAVLKAKSANMPKDNIDRAVKKGTGELEGVEYLEMSYEGYGPGGVAVLIEVLTDNKNRTAADVRNILTKGGGNLGETGCVSYLFKRTGLLAYPTERYQEDDIMEAAIEAGAADVETQDDTIEVLCAPEDFDTVTKEMEAAGYEHTIAELSWIPEATIELDADKAGKALRLIEQLEDNDDVQNVSTNLEIPEDAVVEG